MNDLYTHTIEFRGRRYRYDPDHDCFYPVEQSMTTWDRVGWLAVILVLTIVCYLSTVL